MSLLRDKKNPALLLSGGGIKAAAFHVGVCIALSECGFSFASDSSIKKNKKSSNPENPLTFKIYIGSSAGAMIVSILVSGFDVYDLIEAFLEGSELEALKTKRKTTSPKRGTLKPISYGDIFSINSKAPSQIMKNFFSKSPVIRGGLEVLLKKNFKLSGLFSTKNLGRYLQENVLEKNNFQDLSVDLSILATSLDKSEQVVFGKTKNDINSLGISYKNHVPISDAVCASATLPPLFSPYGIPNEEGNLEYYFDGEIRDTLPVSVADDKGADLVIASSSIQPYEFHPEIGSLQKYGAPLIINQAIYQMIQQKTLSDIHFRNQSKKLVEGLEDILNKATLERGVKTKVIDHVLESLSYSPDRDYIYIYPSSEDYQMFFYDHFSLSEKVLSQIVRIGFKSAMHTLRPYLSKDQLKNTSSRSNKKTKKKGA